MQDFDKTMLMMREKLNDFQKTRDLMDRLDEDPRKMLAD